MLKLEEWTCIKADECYCYLSWGEVSISRRLVTNCNGEEIKNIKCLNKFPQWCLSMALIYSSTAVWHILWKATKKELVFWATTIHRMNCIPNESTSLLWGVFSNKISTAPAGLGVACVQPLSLLQLTQAVVLPSGTSLWSPAPLSCLSSRLRACQVQSPFLN